MRNMQQEPRTIRGSRRGLVHLVQMGPHITGPDDSNIKHFTCAVTRSLDQTQRPWLIQPLSTYPIWHWAQGTHLPSNPSSVELRVTASTSANDVITCGSYSNSVGRRGPPHMTRW